MMKRVLDLDLVVFDLAGTTIDDTGGAVLACLMRAAHAYNLPGEQDELNALMGMNKAEVFAMLAERAHGAGVRSDEVARQALELFYGCMRAHYDEHLRPMAGAEDTFRFLKDLDVRVAIDTGFDGELARLITSRLGWTDGLVDTVVASSDVPRGRPAPYMVFRAMERLDVIDVRKVMKIGDSPADLEEGTNAGCGEVVGVLSGAHDEATLCRYPHTRILGGVADLPALFA